MSSYDWMRVALAEFGQAELPGLANNNPRIMEYLRSTRGHWPNDETPWCAAFVSWVLTEAGIGSLRSARAADWAGYGMRLSAPTYGAIVVLRPNPARNQAGSGHVGFYVRGSRTHMYLLGGNQANSVCISRFPWSNERPDGYRWPVITGSRSETMMA